MIQHLRQEARRVCTATEPEEDDVVSRGVVAHEKFVTANHMFVERGAGEEEGKCKSMIERSER